MLASIPEKRVNKVKDIDLRSVTLPNERTLGVIWRINKDVFTYVTVMHDKPMTRRGKLSMASALFDLLGFEAPFILIAKRLLQELERQNVGWDEPVGEDFVASWAAWRQDVKLLECYKVPRCYLQLGQG